MYWMNQPFSVSVTSARPSRPRCLTNSVRVDHLVAFMCKCCLSEMYSWYTTLAWTRRVP